MADQEEAPFAPSPSFSGEKRKAEDDVPHRDTKSFDHDNASTSSPAKSEGSNKKQKKDALVELEGKKLRFKQTPFAMGKHAETLIAIAQFQKWWNGQKDAAKIPDEQLHVVAKLVQESGASVSALAREVLGYLSPQSDDSDDLQDGASSLDVKVVTKAINKIATRTNYGLSISDVAKDSEELVGKSEGSLAASHPLRKWAFYCWEVDDLSLVTNDAKMLAKISSRRQERQDIREHTLELYESLSEEQRAPLLSAKMRTRKSGDSTKVAESSEASEASKMAGPSNTDDSASGGQMTEKSLNRRKSRSPSKSPTPKAKKEKSPDKLEKKQKLKEAREVKEEQKKKIERDLKRSAASLSSFFVKKRKAQSDKGERPEAIANDRSEPSSSNLGQSSTVAGDELMSEPQAVSTPTSDFHKVFYPSKYKDLAPLNRFCKTSATSVSMDEQLSSSSALPLSAELLPKLLAAFGPAPPRACSVKGVHPSVCVRQVMTMMSESDVLGGDAAEQARRGLNRLSNPRLVKYKLHQFHTDRRPAWFGTHTKSSNFVRPRNPLAQDPVALDYSYDSDDGWLSDPQDDDPNADDVNNDLDCDSEDDTAISEADSWLEDDMHLDDEADEGSLDTSLENEDDDDDDEIVEVDSKGHSIAPNVASSLSPLARRGPNKPMRNFMKSKMWAKDKTKRQKKKKQRQLGRRFDSKLIAFSTGPHWETTYGVAAYPNFQPYCVEFLNDACYGLNPFTFVSAEVEESKCPDTGAGDTSAPEPQAASTSVAMPDTSGGAVTILTAKKGRPKAPFPGELVPTLLRHIEASTRTTKVLVVEDAREMFAKMETASKVSKAAIEAAVVQYGMKSGSKNSIGTWKVKDEYRHLLDQDGTRSSVPSGSTTSAQVATATVPTASDDVAPSASASALDPSDLLRAAQPMDPQS